MNSTFFFEIADVKQTNAKQCCRDKNVIQECLSYCDNTDSNSNQRMFSQCTEFTPKIEKCFTGELKCVISPSKCVSNNLYLIPILPISCFHFGF